MPPSPAGAGLTSATATVAPSCGRPVAGGGTRAGHSSHSQAERGTQGLRATSGGETQGSTAQEDRQAMLVLQQHQVGQGVWHQGHTHFGTRETIRQIAPNPQVLEVMGYNGKIISIFLLYVRWFNCCWNLFPSRPELCHTSSRAAGGE